MKTPWRKRAPINVQRSFDAAQTKPPKATKTPPIEIIGWMGNLSAKKPKGKLDMAIPKITAETVNETRTKSVENSFCSTGNIG
jgi:hypothetical protein